MRPADDLQTSETLIARLERLPPSPLHLRARILVGTATFFDGYNVLAISFALPVLAGLWHLRPPQIGFLITAGNLGSLLGALFFGWAAERYGRLRIVAWTIAIFGVFSLASAFAWDAQSLAWFRFLQGIGLGGEVPVAAAYISELTRARGRGRFYLLYELIFPVGLLAAALLGFWLVPRVGFRSLFVIGALPALLIPFLLRALPESPRWLLAHHRIAESQAVVTELERSYAATGNALPPVPAAKAPEAMIRASWRDLFAGIYLPRTLVVWTVWFTTYMVTYGLLTWLPTLYRTVFHLSLATSLGYSLIMQAIGLIGSFLCAIYIDRVGRQRWIASALILGGLSLFIVPIAGLGHQGLIVLITVTIAAFCINSVALAVYLFTAEMYPTRMRAFATSVGTAWLRLASAIGPTLVGFMLVGYGIPAIFITFAIIPILGGVVTAIWAVESRGRQLEEVSP